MQEPSSQPSRRGFFVGAAATGVAAAAMVSTRQQVAPEVAKEVLPPAPENGGGYSLSEHVKTYYKTARV
jgi:hypothetical protein